ncbi:MAG TPA: hypothetical protein VMR74_16370 [Gammaproteobacteria bacterium]|nr:hypothetical protein [Gammaproteobacteria bacterium]
MLEPNLIDFVLWLMLGGVIGFFYGRRRFDRRVSEATDTVDSREALKISDPNLKVRLRAQRREFGILYGAIGAAVSGGMFGVIALFLLILE